MNNIEEQLWSYLDGSCNEQEKSNIAHLIATDKTWREKYKEIQEFNQELSNIELDEPSMAFTYKVMEAVRAEEASKPLKAAIDHRIIKSIAAFFIISLMVLLVLALASTNWSSEAGAGVHIPVEVKLPSLKNYLGGQALKGFLFFDVVLALFLFDSILRQQRANRA